MNNIFKQISTDIILPNYNSELYISETIDSVINQTFKNWNLTIVDDNSNIETLNEEITSEEWTVNQDKKLLMLYKKNVPEHALARILKKKLNEIRNRILYLSKK